MVERIQHTSARMAAGDTGAIDSFHHDYFDWMYSQAQRLTRRDESFCLDVVQNAMLRVMRTVKAVDDETRFRSWLRLVVQTAAFDELRGEVRRQNRLAMTDGPQQQIESDSRQLDSLREQISESDPDLVDLIELRLARTGSLLRMIEKAGLSISPVDNRLKRAIRNPRLPAEDAPIPESSPEPVVADEIVPLQVLVTEIGNEHIAVISQPAVQKLTEEIVIAPVPASEVAVKEVVAAPLLASMVVAGEVVAAPMAAVDAVMNEIATAPPTIAKAVTEDFYDLTGLEDEAGAYDDAI